MCVCVGGGGGGGGGVLTDESKGKVQLRFRKVSTVPWFFVLSDFLTTL